MFGIRGLLDSGAQSIKDMTDCPSDVRAGGVAIAGASCERLGLYAGQRYSIASLFWRPANAPFTPDEPRVAAQTLSDAPPSGDWELCAELLSQRWMPWGSTEVSVGADAARLRSVRAELFGSIAVALGVAAVWLVALPALTVVSFAYVPSDSMAPTLERGDAVVVSLHPPAVAVGDIVLFEPPPQLIKVIAAAGAPPLRSGDRFLKRVVGVAGDTLSAQHGVVSRNGALELHAPAGGCARCKPASYDWKPLTLEPGQLAVLGDNRGGSTDSHVWGALDTERIVGRVIWRWWPLERFGDVR